MQRKWYLNPHDCWEGANHSLGCSFQIMFIALYDESAANHGLRRIKLCPFGHFLREQYVLNGSWSLLLLGR